MVLFKQSVSRINLTPTNKIVMYQSDTNIHILTVQWKPLNVITLRPDSQSHQPDDCNKRWIKLSYLKQMRPLKCDHNKRLIWLVPESNGHSRKDAKSDQIDSDWNKSLR